METYSVFLPSYTVGVDAYKAVPEVCCVFGSKAVVICGKHEEKATKELLQGVAGSSIKILGCLWYGGNSTNENIEKLKADKRVQEADMVFAVGGGRVCDLAKILGQQTGKPYFTFPTLASNCAPATSAAVLYNADGSIQNIISVAVRHIMFLLTPRLLPLLRNDYYGPASAMPCPKNMKLNWQPGDWI